MKTTLCRATKTKKRDNTFGVARGLSFKVSDNAELKNEKGVASLFFEDHSLELGITQNLAQYEGWMNQLDTPSRYEYRGKVAAKRFERDCLAEYAEVFKTVCIDAAYYTFPRCEYLKGLADQVPDNFRSG